MTVYKVINRFKDKQHNGHIYEVGNTYPAEGKKLVKSRAEELTKVHPKYGIAFLEVVEEAAETPKITRRTAKKDPKTTENNEKSDE